MNRHHETLVVHDDSVISRVAWLLEQRKGRIDLYRRIISGEDVGAEHRHINLEAVEQALENEKWLLNDLIEDIQEGVFHQELKQMFEEYVVK